MRVVEPDAGRPGIAAIKLGEKLLEIDLLVVDDIGLIGGEVGIADQRGRLHRAQCRDQFGIFVLRLVEEDIQTDRLGFHIVDDPQRPREHPAIKRGTLARIDQRLIVIDDHGDAIVLFDPVGQKRTAQIVERPLGIAGTGRLHVGLFGTLRAERFGNGLPGDVPAEPRDQQSEQYQQCRERKTTRPGLAHIAPAAKQQIIVPVLAQTPPPCGSSSDPLIVIGAVLEQPRGGATPLRHAMSGSFQASTGLRAACVSSSRRRGA